MKNLLRVGQKQSYKIKNILFKYFLQFRSTEHVFMIVAAILIGLIGGFGAIGIQYLIKTFQIWFWGAPEFHPDHIKSVPAYVKILVPAGGSLAVGFIIYFFAREAKGHGVPEVMKAIAQNNGVIRARVAIAKLLASSLYIGAGGSVGREGPVIQIGSSIGSTVGQVLRVNPQRMKVFVACGASAGIAAAFNTPIAGALFSVEIILCDFAFAQFSPIVISSVIGTAVSRSFLGNYPAFEVPKYELLSPYELVFYAGLGVLAGGISLLYIKSLYACEGFYERLNVHEIVKPAIGGVAIGGIGILMPQIYGVGYHSIIDALHGDILWPTMLLLIFVKILATSISLGSGGSGGVFAPALFIGTMTGGFFGTIVHQSFAFAAHPGAYALVGMAALVAGTTHAPLTAMLIIFEMTNDYKIILPLMISCVIATMLASKLEKESIYTLKLARQGLDWLRGRDINVLRPLKVANVMRKEMAVISVSTSLSNLIELFYDNRHSQFFVEDQNHILVGRIDSYELKQYLHEGEVLSPIVIAHDLMRPNVVKILEGDSLDDIMRIFGHYAVEELPVVDSRNGGQIIGVVFYKDVINAYNQQLIKQDIVQETNASLKLMERSSQMSLPGGYTVMEIPASAFMVGKSVKDLNLRHRFSVNILMIKRTQNANAETYISPDPEERINSGDKLVAMGMEKDMEKLKHL